MGLTLARMRPAQGYKVNCSFDFFRPPLATDFLPSFRAASLDCPAISRYLRRCAHVMAAHRMHIALPKLCSRLTHL